MSVAHLKPPPRGLRAAGLRRVKCTLRPGERVDPPLNWTMCIFGAALVQRFLPECSDAPTKPAAK